eukprot:CAMPEP_0184396928 /NCGR_PEP_ID=MMETSP0007-20130409/56514_1 /TAXON_ID=97485 /ORGANISM="Prymnesium parvum, Strain Texoma1" /LENGTH=36 /DNA_ID= /DNA_START= /DNA_END= /DNA_ORIENTATION=
MWTASQAILATSTSSYPRSVTATVHCARAALNGASF